MPIFLDSIPDALPKVKRPRMKRWLLFLVFCILIGAFITAFSWRSERSGFLFWFSALGLPFCLWGLMFSLRRFGYKVEQRVVESRNVERDILINNEITRGQRFAWILGGKIQTAAGRNSSIIWDVMALSVPIFESVYCEDSYTVVNYAPLSESDKNIDNIISDTSAYIKGIMNDLPKSVVCWLMIDSDEETSLLVESGLKKSLISNTERRYYSVVGSGMEGFDAWLDKRWDTPSVFFSITIDFAGRPQDGDADAVTVLAFSNRKAEAYPNAAKLHRPEKGKIDTLNTTLSRSLLWANRSAKDLQGAWVSGSLLTDGFEWNIACEEHEVTFSLTEDNKCIDPILGYAGKASPWLAISMANIALKKGVGAQVVATQPLKNDEVWLTILSKNESSKEISGNV